MYFRANFILSSVIIIIIIICKTNLSFSQSDERRPGTCGLLGKNPYGKLLVTFPIYDQVEENTETWIWPIYGSVLKIVVEASPHLPYLKGRFCSKSGQYHLISTNQTKFFTRNMLKQDINRNITFECSDGSFNLYYLQAPLWDLLAPRLLSTKQVFNIPSNWNRTLPLSDPQTCFVAASFMDVEGHNLHLKECSSSTGMFMHNNTLSYRFFKIRTSMQPNPHAYRIDFFLDELTQLEPGLTITKCYIVLDPNGLQSTDTLQIDIFVY